MDPVDLYCFSGTGNTLIVARAMRDRFAERGVEAALHRLEDCDPADVDRSHILGIACPVAAQSTYPTVWEFVRGLPEADGTGAFLVDTLMMFSGGLLGPMKHCLKKKGYAPLGAREVRMPNNFFRKKTDPEKDAGVIESGREAARAFVDALVDGSARWPPARPWEWLFFAGMKLGYGKPRLIGRMARPSVDPERCTQCGLCEKLCPVGAVTRPAGTPQFSRDCIACMRCFSYCPAEAIRLRNSSKYVPYRPLKAADLLGSDDPLRRHTPKGEAG